jgi:hypothetical protein
MGLPKTSSSTSTLSSISTSCCDLLCRCHGRHLRLRLAIAAASIPSPSSRPPPPDNSHLFVRLKLGKLSPSTYKFRSLGTSPMFFDNMVVDHGSAQVAGLVSKYAKPYKNTSFEYWTILSLPVFNIIMRCYRFNLSNYTHI